MSECRRFEKIARREDPRGREDFVEHARECAACRAELALWEAVDQAAPTLTKSWESPDLWPRIEAAMGEESMRDSADAHTPPAAPGRSWVPLAAAAALFAIAMIGLQVFRPSFGERELLKVHAAPGPLLTESALDQVEKSEAGYVASIDRLAALAEPKLKEPATPLLTSYREKLLLLDGAIADLRAQVDQNRFNTHLRRELLAMYQEKQRTLEQVVGENKS